MLQFERKPLTRRFEASTSLGRMWWWSPTIVWTSMLLEDVWNLEMSIRWIQKTYPVYIYIIYVCIYIYSCIHTVYIAMNLYNNYNNVEFWSLKKSSMQLMASWFSLHCEFSKNGTQNSRSDTQMSRDVGNSDLRCVCLWLHLAVTVARLRPSLESRTC